MRLTDVRPSIIVGSVPVGAMILALLQACAASAASCTPISVTTCCEYDSNPCPETHSNSSFDGVCNDPIIKMLTYQVTFPDAAFWSGTLIGSGAAANPGTCAFVNLIWPLLMLSFGPTWPLFRLPSQTQFLDPLP